MKEEGKRRGSSPGGGALCKWRGGRWGRRARTDGTAKTGTARRRAWAPSGRLLLMQQNRGQARPPGPSPRSPAPGSRPALAQARPGEGRCCGWGTGVNLPGARAGLPGCCRRLLITVWRESPLKSPYVLLLVSLCLLGSISFTCRHESTRKDRCVCFDGIYPSHIF